MGCRDLGKRDGAADEAVPAAAGNPKLSLKDKTVAVRVVGSDHFFDRKAYPAQTEAVKELGGTPIGFDAARNGAAALLAVGQA